MTFSFTISPSPAQVGETITFTATSDYEFNAFEFGDGSVTYSKVATHVYTKAGTYTVKLRGCDDAGNPQYETTQTITIYEEDSSSGFYAKTIRGKVPLEVAFINESEATGNTYAWDFGDGSTSTDTHPTHTYTNAQTYTVKLIVTNAAGTATYLKEDYIRATDSDPPVAGFTHTLTGNTGSAPVAVTFTNTSTGTITSYAWDFGDGSTSTDTNPTHTFNTPGFYFVKLSAVNEEWEDELLVLFYIRNFTPTLIIFATPITGFSPLEIAFSSIIEGTYQRLIWDFGDDSTSTLLSPTHTYTTPGTYTVTLSVYQETLLYPVTTTRTFTIKDPSTLPTAAFSADVTSGTDPLLVSFTDSSTGTITAYLWDFGDDSTSTSQNPSHTYTEPGIYTVTLTVTSSIGSDTETKTAYITVTAAPDADFTANKVIGWTPLAVTFTDASLHTPTSWAWDFDDTGTSSSQNPTHTFTDVRSYWVELTATNAIGSDTKGMDITVVPSGYPLASFSYAVTAYTPPYVVIFTDTSIGTGLSYLWDFGDGSTSTSQNPTHEYQHEGEYVVSLTVSNSLGKHTKKVRING